MKGGKDDRLKPDRSSKYDNNHVGFFLIIKDIVVL